MTGLADLLVKDARRQGFELTYDVADADLLDRFVDDVAATDPAGDLVQSMSQSLGAYLGELIVRRGHGEWIVEPTTQLAGVRLFASDLTCFPMTKITKRFQIGREHSAAQFLNVALSGELPRTARRLDPPATG